MHSDSPGPGQEDHPEVNSLQNKILKVQNFQNPGALVHASVTYPDGVQTTDWFLPGTVPNWGVLLPNPGPNPGHGPQFDPGPTPAPYCSTYSFAFAPPAGNGIPANGEWW